MAIVQILPAGSSTDAGNGYQRAMADAGTAANAVVEIDGRKIRLTHLDRVLWPAGGLTKRWMLNAYTRLAPALLPHIRGHPITMWRYPQGVHRNGWWQNECRGAPDWLNAYTYTGKDGRDHRHCIIDDLSSLLWMVNLGTVELHPFLFTADEPARPRWLVFDLDPGEPAMTRDACVVALLLREVLEGQGLASFPKSSGAKGVHVYVPLNTRATFDETKAYARTIAVFLAREHPDLVVDRQTRDLRRGKVLVDWLQNDAFRSTVAPYSLRATSRPRLSTPVTWEEVDRAAHAHADDSLSLSLETVLDRLERDGDLFGPVLELHQELAA
jgi:bifunctional non-homologous end joining protein LigD